MQDRTRKVVVLAAVVAVLLAIDLALYVRIARPRLIHADTCAPGYGGTTFSNESYAAVLARHVDAEGMVNYRDLKRAPRNLDRFLHDAACLAPATYNGWAEDVRIAFWTNLYNAWTLRVIADHHPVRPTALRRLLYPAESIRQIPGVWTKLRFVVMGEEWTLDRIKREKLLAGLDEPRVHLALAPAAQGSAPLRQEPYDGARLDRQLDDQARAVLAREGDFHIDRKAGKVRLPAVFDGVGDDFVKTCSPPAGFGDHPAGLKAVLNFIAGRLPDADAEFLRSGKYAVEYAPFDWLLNRHRYPPNKAIVPAKE